MECWHQLEDSELSGEAEGALEVVFCCPPQPMSDSGCTHVQHGHGFLMLRKTPASYKVRANFAENSMRPFQIRAISLNDNVTIPAAAGVGSC